MRIFESKNEMYYVGKTKEIKAMFKSIVRSGLFFPLFCNFPKFSEEKEIYVLCIEDGYVTILNSDTMLSLIVNNDVKEVK